MSVIVDRIVVEKQSSFLLGLFQTEHLANIVPYFEIGKEQSLSSNNEILGRIAVGIPIMVQYDIEDYEDGSIAILSSIPLMTQFSLTSIHGEITETVTHFDVRFAIFNTKKDTLLTRFIPKLPDYKELQFLSGKYSVALDGISTLLSSVVDAVTEDESFRKDLKVSGRVRNEFLNCQSDGILSCTYLYVRSSERSSTSVVAINDIQSYCFFGSPGYDSIYFERKDDDGSCTYKPGNVTRLANSYFTLTVCITTDVEDKEGIPSQN